MVISNGYDSLSPLLKINVREHRRGKQKWTSQTNWQQKRRQRKQKHTTVGKETQIMKITIPPTNDCR
jgi:hypothetical protein